MHGFYHTGFFGGGGLMLIFWIVLAAGVIWLLFSMKNGRRMSAESALDIAKKRYAAGEITKPELDEISKNL